MIKKENLAHVLWIGGGTDAGKSTAAREYAQRHSFAVYHCDHTDKRQQEALARSSEDIRDFLQASLDERWIDPEPEEMLSYLFTLFSSRFELILQELLAMPADQFVVVEGFGILLELVEPYLSHPNQAIWFVPTESFKRASMDRRGKPSFGAKTSNPALAKRNLFERDMLLSDYIRRNVGRSMYALHVTDGTMSIEQTVGLLETHFQPYLSSYNHL